MAMTLSADTTQKQGIQDIILLNLKASEALLFQYFVPIPAASFLYRMMDADTMYFYSFIAFPDDFTHFTWTFCARSRDDIYDVYKNQMHDELDSLQPCYQAICLRQRQRISIRKASKYIQRRWKD